MERVQEIGGRIRAGQVTLNASALDIEKNNPREILHGVMKLCADCDVFRTLMEEDCAFFLELYHLWDQEKEHKVPITDAQLPNLTLKRYDPKNIYRDDGYSASLDPLNRINLAEHLFDVGEYLARLHDAGQFNTHFSDKPLHVVYYAPCHQREQNIGSPYLDLLRLIPGLAIEPVGSGMDCCGMGGNFGFKADFHEKTLPSGSP